LALFVAALYAGLFNLDINDLLNLHVVIGPDQGEPFISTMLGSLATIVAIYFSIVILAVQHAAGNYTASILDDYKRDSSNWFTYTFLIGELVLCALMLKYESSSLILTSGKSISFLNFSLVMFVFSFVILTLQFLHIFDLVNPIRIIRKAQTVCVDKIRPLEKYNVIEQSRKNQAIVKETHEKIVQIADILYKSSLKREAETYVASLSAFADIATQYSLVQKNIVSITDEFLNTVYEILLSASKIAFQNEDTLLFAELMKSIEAIGISTLVKPSQTFGVASDAASLAVSHIHDIGFQALHRNLLDVAIQAIKSIKNLGTKSLEIEKTDSLAAEKLFHLGSSIIDTQDIYPIQITLNALKELLIHSVQGEVSVFMSRQIMTPLCDLSVKAIDNKISYKAFSFLFPIKLENSLLTVVQEVLKVKNGTYPIMNTRKYEEYTREIVSELLVVIDRIAAKAAAKDSPVLLNQIVDCVGEIAKLLVNEKFKTYRDGFHDELMQAIELLSDWVIVRQRGMPRIAWDGSDPLTMLALVSVDYGLDNIATECEKAIMKKCVQLISVDSSRNYAPEFASRITVIGVYANCNGKTSLATHCVDDLVTFEGEYLNQSGTKEEIDGIIRASKIRDRIIRIGLDDASWEEKYNNLPTKCIDDFDKLHTTKRGY